MHRQWLDWQRPLLPAAAAWLIERHADGRRCDLRTVRCVLPGARAGRVLLHLLLRQCAERGLRLVPPQVLTPGALVELLTPGDARTASTLECQLAWMHVLREASPELIAPLLPSRPEFYDWPAWHEFAGQIAAIVDELSGELLTLRDVARVATRMQMDREADRWAVLEKLEGRYRERLHRCERTCPHERRREMIAALVDGAVPVDPEHELVLIGVIDLARVHRAIVRAYGDRATALVHAPEALASGFDADGCVERPFWTGRPIEIPDDQLVIADRPADQAQAVVRCLAELGGAYRPEEVTIGLGDEKLAPAMAQAGVWADIALHDPRGLLVLHGRPFRLLQAGLEWVREPHFASFASLLRHPDVEAFIRRQLSRSSAPAGEAVPTDTAPATGPEGPVPEASAPAATPEDDHTIVEWLTVLDRYYTEHLQDGFDGTWLGDEKAARRMQIVHDLASKLYRPLGGQRRPLVDWFEPILDVLRIAYGHLNVNTPQLSEARVAATCLEVAKSLGGLTGAAPGLQPEVDGPTALRLVLSQLAGLRVPEDPRSGQIEMLGWLELHHDPAPVLVLAGCNDGAVPQAVSADAFLPDSLREHLGVLCNGRRFARDAYLIEAIRRSRARCTFIAGRQAADGEPLTPSRLLLAGDLERLPARVLRLCDPNHARRWALPYGAPPAGATSGFRVPDPPDGAASPAAMTVTEFGWYLRCPFRYYLKYVRRLRLVDDSAVELDALQFGNLTHEVLQRFGEDASVADSTDPDRITAYLDDLLVDRARATYGARPLPAIRIQLSRLRQRLHVFSRHQARRRADGWKIQRCEFELPEETWLSIPDQEPMRIKGKIDRIDRNERDGSWMIIDYKTSESGNSPDKTHRAARTSARQWNDLQLPLYHHLAAQHGYTGPVQLAYMNLPKKPEQEALVVARWTAADLDDAIGTARDIVRNIRAGRFEMADDFPARYQDDFANICQTRVFGGGDDMESDA